MIGRAAAQTVTGAAGRRGGRRGGRRRGRGEQPMVPEAEFTSYYGRPILKEPVWKVPDVPAYLFLGGVAGASSALAASATATGHGAVARAAKSGAAAAITLSVGALVHDLGRPERFLNMLRVFKPTSPMSVGSWLLAAYGPAAAAAAASELTGRLPLAGRAATFSAGVLGPGIATYTAALICDTAVPAWHEAYREMPYVFAGSAASAAGGLSLMAVPPAEAGPARDLAVFGAAVELVAKRRLLARLSRSPGQNLAEPYEVGTTGTIMRAAEIATAAGLVGAVLGRRSRGLSVVSGACLLTASALTRYGIFQAGRVSARDPKYTVIPQRARANARAARSRGGDGGTGGSNGSRGAGALSDTCGVGNVRCRSSPLRQSRNSSSSARGKHRRRDPRQLCSAVMSMRSARRWWG